jgi:hypothetical protein
MCSEFQCETHYDPKEAMYTRQALDMWKELKKTGLTFGGRRKQLEKPLKQDLKKRVK